jgi:hypothetical protein
MRINLYSVAFIDTLINPLQAVRDADHLPASFHHPVPVNIILENLEGNREAMEIERLGHIWTRGLKI